MAGSPRHRLAWDQRDRIYHFAVEEHCRGAGSNIWKQYGNQFGVVERNKYPIPFDHKTREIELARRLNLPPQLVTSQDQMYPMWHSCRVAAARNSRGPDLAAIAKQHGHYRVLNDPERWVARHHTSWLMEPIEVCSFECQVVCGGDVEMTEETACAGVDSAQDPVASGVNFD